MKKFKLKKTSYSFDHKGMIIEGECGNGIVKALAKDLCKTNENIMTKKEIMDCMSNGAYYKWNYYWIVRTFRNIQNDSFRLCNA